MIKKVFFNLKFGFGKNSTKALIQEYNEEIRYIRKQIEEGKLDETAYEDAEKKFTQSMKKADLEERTVKIKKYILDNIKEDQQKSKAKDAQYIPNFLEIKKLNYENRKILLFGVEEENEDHSIYIKKMAQKMNIKSILTAIAPDMPYFIRTQQSYIQEWSKFLKKPKDQKLNAMFYVSPTPKSLEDLCLDDEKINLVKHGLTKSQQFNQIFYAMLQYNDRWDLFIPNALLSPFITYGVQKIYFCDYPMLKQREMWANSITTQKLKQLFEVYRMNFKNQKLKNFDARILFPKEVMIEKYKYMANIVKLTSLHNENISFFICPSEYTEMFLQQWKSKSRPNSYLQYNTCKKLQQIPFLEYIEKLVILDFICEPLLSKYFIPHKSFPYFGQHTIGGKEHIGKIFIIWEHFYELYRKKLNETSSQQTIGDEFEKI